MITLTIEQKALLAFVLILLLIEIHEEDNLPYYSDGGQATLVTFLLNEARPDLFREVTYLERTTFDSLVTKLTSKGLLEDGRSVTCEEQLKENIDCERLQDPKYFAFKKCLGALDGVLIPMTLPMHKQEAYRSRKSIISQNVLAVVNFDLEFLYVLKIPPLCSDCPLPTTSVPINRFAPLGRFMSTRRTNPGINVPITDPKAILRAARAEQRCVQRTAAHLAAETESREAAQHPLPCSPIGSPPREPSPPPPSNMHDPNSAANPNLNIPSTTPAGSTSASRTPSVDPPGRTAHQDTAEAAATREAIRVMIATQKASITDLHQPIRITLALHTEPLDPIYLRQKTCASFTDPESSLEFPDVTLKIGPVKGPYDMILGTPFLYPSAMNTTLQQ
ncbi:hypothetical protein PCASD_11718 [Puccinia coronata f. sp. avenae]|uniref:Uncharacterized protein n=1 Tax=Puccinia coronata f. sp. avenae TaxID=200324 RepID=A0A2N5UMG1_9BASI|nr:hypothetical protein PCASD_11718 [Puccinia coronata f. sp. avenae]